MDIEAESIKVEIDKTKLTDLWTTNFNKHQLLKMTGQMNTPKYLYLSGVLDACKYIYDNVDEQKEAE